MPMGRTQQIQTVPCLRVVHMVRSGLNTLVLPRKVPTPSAVLSALILLSPSLHVGAHPQHGRLRLVVSGGDGGQLVERLVAAGCEAYSPAESRARGEEKGSAAGWLLDPLPSLGVVVSPRPLKPRGWQAAEMPTRPLIWACEAQRVLPVVPSPVSVRESIGSTDAFYSIFTDQRFTFSGGPAPADGFYECNRAGTEQHAGRFPRAQGAGSPGGDRAALLPAALPALPGARGPPRSRAGRGAPAPSRPVAQGPPGGREHPGAGRGGGSWCRPPACFLRRLPGTAAGAHCPARRRSRSRGGLLGRIPGCGKSPRDGGASE